MPVPVKMSDLSTLAASNSPSGSDAIGNSLDDYLRAAFAIMRSTNAQASSSIASASTTDIGAADGESVTITGTTTITSFGTTAAGIKRECKFSGALQITNSTAIILPNAANITTQAGDIITFRSLGSGNWQFVSSSRLTGVPDGFFTIAKTSGLQSALDAKANLSGATFSGSVAIDNAGGQYRLNFVNGATTNALMGAAQTTSDIITGSNSGDFCIRSQVGAIRFAPNGITQVLGINSTGVSVTGSVTATSVSAGTITQTSDVRLKKSIKTFEPRDLSEVRLTSYQWKDGSGEGLSPIAQEVAQIAPEYVHKRDDGFLGVDKAALALERVAYLESIIKRLGVWS